LKVDHIGVCSSSQKNSDKLERQVLTGYDERVLVRGGEVWFGSAREKQFGNLDEVSFNGDVPDLSITFTMERLLSDRISWIFSMSSLPVAVFCSVLTHTLIVLELRVDRFERSIS
jgi:hypothetical protein